MNNDLHQKLKTSLEAVFRGLHSDGVFVDTTSDKSMVRSLSQTLGGDFENLEYEKQIGAINGYYLLLRSLEHFRDNQGLLKEGDSLCLTVDTKKISFNGPPGAVDSLKQKYPEHITLVLEHIYSDLKIGHNGKENTASFVLRFGGLPVGMEFPFSAVEHVAVPSAEVQYAFMTLRQDFAQSALHPNIPVSSMSKKALPPANENTVIEVDFANRRRVSPSDDEPSGDEPS